MLIPNASFTYAFTSVPRRPIALLNARTLCRCCEMTALKPHHDVLNTVLSPYHPGSAYILLAVKGVFLAFSSMLRLQNVNSQQEAKK